MPALANQCAQACGQLAFGAYLRDPTARIFHAIGFLVLTLAGGRISAITRFDNRVLPHFRLSRTLPVDDGLPGDPYSA